MISQEYADYLANKLCGIITPEPPRYNYSELDIEILERIKSNELYIIKIEEIRRPNEQK